MTTQQAQSAVSLSALVVAGVYAYRKLAEKGTSGNVTAAPLSHFVLGFGFTFIGLSLAAQAAPEFGGMFAVLVAAADLLVNGNKIVSDLTTGLKNTATSSSSSSGSNTDAAAAVGVAEIGQTPGVTDLVGGGTGTFHPPTNLPNPAP